LRVLQKIRDSLPKDAFGWILVLVSLGLSAAIYFGRILWRKIDGIGAILCLPVICLFGLIFVFHTVSLLRYTAKSRKELPAVILFGTAMFALLLPLLPTAEQTLFVSYRAEYEQLVQLAQSSRLPTSEECGGESVYAYPSEFEHLRGASTGTTCIFVETAPTLTIEFSPLDFYRPIVYFENPQRIRDTVGPCNGDGGILSQLSSNWFACKRDWN
jgi:hypothetical protein